VSLVPNAPERPMLRFAHHCPRRAAHTIRRARWLNLIPWHSKPHPQLRFTSLTPAPPAGRTRASSGRHEGVAVGGAGAGVSVQQLAGAAKAAAAARVTAKA